jgi:hypothetical protein
LSTIVLDFPKCPWVAPIILTPPFPSSRFLPDALSSEGMRKREVEKLGGDQGEVPKSEF